MKFNKMYNHPEGDLFQVEFPKKLTVLLGRNGAGKTTMLQAIEQEYDRKDDYRVVNDDAANRGDSMGNVFDPQHIANSRFASEGEVLINTIGTMAGKIGSHVRAKKKVIACLDKIDSGLSIDRIKEVADFLKETLIEGVEATFISANSYELASQFRDVADFYWVIDKKFIELPATYEEFIKLYE